MKKINLKKYVAVIVGICLVICVLALLGSKYDEQFKVVDLQSQCRWTDSAYVTIRNGKASISEDAPLSQWPMGHDVLVYESMGRLDIIMYSETVRWGNYWAPVFEKDKKRIYFGCSISPAVSVIKPESNPNSLVKKKVEAEDMKLLAETETSFYSYKHIYYIQEMRSPYKNTRMIIVGCKEDKNIFPVRMKVSKVILHKGQSMKLKFIRHWHSPMTYEEYLVAEPVNQ